MSVNNNFGSFTDQGRFPFANPAQAVQGYAVLTTTGDTTLIAAAGVGTRIYVTSIIASNTSATPVRLDIRDGATVVFSVYLAASGGGFSHLLPYPWRLSNNTALIATLSGAVTDVRITAHGLTLGT